MNSQILKAKKNHKRLLDRKNNLHVKTKISNIQNVKVIPKIDKLEPLYTNNISIKKIHIRGYWNWNIHNDICAICRNYIFEPSINSTIECIMLWGCISTLILSKGMSNSQWASITSKPLFIRVAESMVTFSPICHEGCLRACSVVTSFSCAGE